MNITFYQQFQENLDKGLEYVLWIGSERWSISKMHSTNLYFVENDHDVREIFEQANEAICYLLLTTEYRSWK